MTPDDSGNAAAAGAAAADDGETEAKAVGGCGGNCVWDREREFGNFAYKRSDLSDDMEQVRLSPMGEKKKKKHFDSSHQGRKSTQQQKLVNRQTWVTKVKTKRTNW